MLHFIVASLILSAVVQGDNNANRKKTNINNRDNRELSEKATSDGNVHQPNQINLISDALKHMGRDISSAHQFGDLKHLTNYGSLGRLQESFYGSLGSLENQQSGYNYDSLIPHQLPKTQLLFNNYQQPRSSHQELENNILHSRQFGENSLSTKPTIHLLQNIGVNNQQFPIQNVKLEGGFKPILNQKHANTFTENQFQLNEYQSRKTEESSVTAGSDATVSTTHRDPVSVPQTYPIHITRQPIPISAQQTVKFFVPLPRSVLMPGHGPVSVTHNAPYAVSFSNNVPVAQPVNVVPQQFPVHIPQPIPAREQQSFVVPESHPISSSIGGTGFDGNRALDHNGYGHNFQTFLKSGQQEGEVGEQIEQSSITLQPISSDNSDSKVFDSSDTFNGKYANNRLDRSKNLEEVLTHGYETLSATNDKALYIRLTDASGSKSE